MNKRKAVILVMTSVIIIVLFSIFYINKNENVDVGLDEEKIRKLAWEQVDPEVKNMSLGGIEKVIISKFTVKEDLKGAIFENNKIFDYEKYSGKILYCIKFDCKKNNKIEPYIIYIDPSNEKIIVSRWGYILLD